MPTLHKFGSFFPPLSIACYDIYDNRIPFASLPELILKLKISERQSIDLHSFKRNLSADKLSLNIKDVMVKCNALDAIRPQYKTSLEISARHDSVSVFIPCQVTPGPLKHAIAKPQIRENILLPGSVIKELKLEMLDTYNNHVEEGLAVKLNVDGFYCADPFGLKRKVNGRGFLDLGGMLKVTAGYGKCVSFSVISEKEVIFKQEFQTENRELRVSSGVPECCTAGSLLEGVVFKIVDSEGEVDVTIHDDEESCQSDTLTIKSASISMEDSIRYAFRHGRCTVPAILVPQNEGLFCFVAAHSHYPELHLSIKIPVVQAELQSSTSDKNILDSQSTSYDKKILPLELEASPSVRNNLMVTMMSTEKQLEHRLLKYGLRIGKCEDELKILNHQKIEIEQVLVGLQGSIEPHILNHLSSSSTKEEIIKRIQSKVQSPAAILCGSNKKFSPQTNVMEEVVGPVALIGTVCTDKLSRVLAEYLGEDQMLAVVCRSLKEALSLEMYKENGEVDILHGLHAQAAALGKSVVGRFHVICLENISPYTGSIDESTPQRRLGLPAPTLPSGNIPPGFMGYAVNMVNLDDQHLRTRTVAGYGLRETLIYRLFGQLQIYSMREHMIQAFAYINHGAVSLDGGILRENGIISLGKWNPDICFPVIWPDAEMHTSPEIMETVKHIKEKKAELERTVQSINGFSELHKRYRNKFNKRKVEYTKLLNSMEPTLLECKPHVKNSLEISPN